MDVLTAILACSLHPDEHLVRAVVDVQSAGHQFFVGDLTTLDSNDSARDATTAQSLVAAIKDRGHRPAIGLMGLPAPWAQVYGRDANELWDTCTNISVGSAKLSEFDFQCSTQAKRRRRGSATATRVCILQKYAAELGLPRAFVAEVLIRATSTSAQSPSTAADQEAASADNGWAPPGFPGSPSPYPAGQPVHPRTTADKPPGR